MTTRVLLVDDHDIVREGVGLLLQERGRSLGIEVVALLSTAEEALDFVRREPVDVVFLDLRLPGMPGEEAVRRLLAIRPELRILMLSGTASGPLPRRVLNDGAVGYLTKGSGIDEMIKAVQTVMTGGRYISQEVAADLVFSDLPGSASEMASQLSNRELQILRLLAEGLTPKEIASQLNLSPQTVSTYKKRLNQKLNTRTTVDLLRVAMEYGLIEQPGQGC
ncbi:MAG: DNA-binding response regulator [Gammaproteobacteria bacterium]|nr:MAG: DNA-binding response regulator [Gammaproteobacteria bacterium]